METIKGIIGKLKYLAGSSRAYAAIGASGLSVATLPAWGQTAVLCVAVACWIGSETFLKLRSK